MKEVLKEVIISIKQHKLRTILTGFGVTWAMFILIILLGAGNGFRSGVLSLFSGYSSNSIWVTGQWTSLTENGGLPQGVRVFFRQEDIEKIRQKRKEIELISPEIPIGSAYSVKYGNKIGNYNVKGVNEAYLKIKSVQVADGRNFNKIDFLKERQVIIIGDQIRNIFFEDEEAIGKYINISDVSFKVVGILGNKNIIDRFEQNSIYAPDVIIKGIFNPEGTFYTFGAQLSNITEMETFEKNLRQSLAYIAGFNKDDNNALYINNVKMQVKVFNKLFQGINILLWAIGLCILLTGMIGVGNIMLVIVKERTQEIGIRKAIGASPNSILILILTESILITLFFGIIGLLFGYGGIALYNWVVVGVQNTTEQVFAKASINCYVILISLLILVLSGVFAGLYPANKAAKIMPIETLNSSNAN